MVRSLSCLFLSSHVALVYDIHTHVTIDNAQQENSSAAKHTTPQPPPLRQSPTTSSTKKRSHLMHPFFRLFAFADLSCT